MAVDQQQVLEVMAPANQQDEFNAPVGQEQVLIEGQIPAEEQKLEQPRVEGLGGEGQGEVAQPQQQIGNIVQNTIHQQPDERMREQGGGSGRQPSGHGDAGMSYIYRGHSGYGRGGLVRGGYGRAQVQQNQAGQYGSGRAAPHHWQPNNLGQSLEDVLQQSHQPNNYTGEPAPRPI